MNQPQQSKEKAAKAAAHLSKEMVKSSSDEVKAIMDSCATELSRPALRHMEMLVDPKRAKPVRPVYSEGGYYAQSGIVKCKTEVDVQIGTNGIGFCLGSPTLSGPWIDRQTIIYSTNSYAGNQSSNLPSTTGVGQILANWQVGYGSIAGQSSTKAVYRCVAAGMYVYPTGSATTQNGDIFLFELDNHKYDLQTTFQSIASALNTRVVRGVQTGDPNIESVVNWHPKFTISGTTTYGDNEIQNDFSFRQAQGTIVDPALQPQYGVFMQGAAGTIFHVEVYGVYELIGTSIANPRPRYYDDQSWCKIQNALNRKAMYGWVGKSTQIISSYKHAVVQTAAPADDLEPESEKALSKAVKGSPSSKGWLESVMDLAPALGDVAKTAAGFLL